MPIDFGRIAEQFADHFEDERKSINDTFENLAKWLRQRIASEEEMERHSRQFPRIDFYNGALTIYVDQRMAGALNSGPALSLWDRLQAGAEAFWHGLGRIGRAVHEEMLPPRFLGATAAMLQTVVDAMERYPSATAAMFDVRIRRPIADIFGEIGVFSRSVLGTYWDPKERRVRSPGLEQIAEFAQAGLAFRQALEGMSPSSAAASGGSGMPAALGEVIQYIAGSLVILPVFWELVDATLRSTGLAVKQLILTAFTEIEIQVHELRRSMIDIFYVRLAHWGRKALNYSEAAGMLLGAQVAFYTSFTQLYVNGLVSGLGSFAGSLATWLNYWLHIVEVIRRILETIMNYDLMPWILTGVLGLSGYLISLLPFIPKFTVDDFISMVTGAGAFAIRKSVNAVLWAVEHIPFIGAGRKARVHALRELVNLAVRVPSLPPETRLPPPAKRFPDIYEAWYGAGAVDIRGAFARLHTSLITEISTASLAAETTLLRLGDRFSAAASRAANLGSVEGFRTIASRSGDVARRVFGQESSGRKADPLAALFEGAVARAGFYVIGEAIPQYIFQMRYFWWRSARRAQPPAKATPTSPHILARRLRIERVRMNRLTIHLPGRSLDDDLIAEVARRFQGAVEDAYRTAISQLEAVPAHG